jgi:hypothetical protein
MESDPESTSGDTVESGDETSGVDAPSEGGDAQGGGEQPPEPPDESAEAVPDEATDPESEGDR